VSRGRGTNVYVAATWSEIRALKKSESADLRALGQRFEDAVYRCVDTKRVEHKEK
jgi:hypothetical protein